ncbi:MAG: PhoH family protein [Myxococcota bacterium]|nr:PhoH family protein [Myxococcota bacterium]
MRHSSPESILGEAATSIRHILTFDDNLTAAELYGDGERNLRIVSRELGVEAHARGNEVRISGPEASVEIARNVLEQLYGVIQSGRRVHQRDVRSAVSMVNQQPDVKLDDVYEDVLSHVGARRMIRAKNLSQRSYIELIRQHDVAIAVGPAGTGKTYLAMAMAIAALNRKEVTRVILTRPAVEAGERLGFLPGDLTDKVDPYMRPLYDALHDMMDFERVQRLTERGVIEVAPLAFMRGRTLNDAFVILDEAQNTTGEQMKMFLTRLGFGSKAVITGDVTQVDLPAATESGLIEAQRVLTGVEGIGVMRFSRRDVVRHPLVQSIIEAYESRGAGSRNRQAGTRDEDSHGA